MLAETLDPLVSASWDLEFQALAITLKYNFFFELILKLTLNKAKHTEELLSNYALLDVYYTVIPFPILAYLDCHNKVPDWATSTTEIYFITVWSLEVKDAGVGSLATASL